MSTTEGAPRPVDRSGDNMSSKKSSLSALLLRRSDRHAPKPSLLLNETEPGLESPVDMHIASSQHDAVSPAAAHAPRPLSRRRNQRGRAPSSEGRRHGKGRPRATLTNEQAAEIYALRGLGEGKSSDISLTFDVAPKTIRDIWNRRTWAHATRQQWSKDEITSHHRNFASHIKSNHTTRTSTGAAGKKDVHAKSSETKKKNKVQSTECNASEADDSISISSCPASLTSHSEAATVKAGSLSPPRATPKQAAAIKHSKSDGEHDASSNTSVAIKVKSKTPKPSPNRVVYKINAPQPGTKGKGLVQRIIDNQVKVHFKVGNKPAAKSSSRPTSVWGKGKILMPAPSASVETPLDIMSGDADFCSPRSTSSVRGLGVMSRDMPKEHKGASAISARVNVGLVPMKLADETPPSIYYDKENFYSSAPGAKCVNFERQEIMSAVNQCEREEQRLHSSIGSYQDGLARLGPLWSGQMTYDDSYCSKDDVKYARAQQQDRDALVGDVASAGENLIGFGETLTEQRSYKFRSSLSLELDKISNWEEYCDEYVETSASTALSGCCQEEPNDSDLMSTISASACISPDISDQEDDIDQYESQRSGDWMDYALSAACLFSPVTTPPVSYSTMSYFGMADESRIV